MTHTMDFSGSTICEGNECVISARLVYDVLNLNHQDHCRQRAQLLAWVGKWWFNALWQAALLRKRLRWALRVLPGFRRLRHFTVFPSHKTFQSLCLLLWWGSCCLFFFLYIETDCVLKLVKKITTTYAMLFSSKFKLTNTIHVTS